MTWHIFFNTLERGKERETAYLTAVVESANLYRNSTTVGEGARTSGVAGPDSGAEEHQCNLEAPPLWNPKRKHRRLKRRGERETRDQCLAQMPCAAT